MGAKKQIRHLSALFEGYNRVKSQSREESQNFLGDDRQRRVSLTIGDLPFCNAASIDMRCQA